MNNRTVGVKVDSLTKVFLTPKGKGGFTAVNKVSLEIPAGKMVTLLGPSGCGKTTILRMLAGFTIPTQGRILFGDTDVTMTPPNKRNVGMMFQSYALFPHMTVYENVAYGLRVQKIQGEQLDNRVSNVLQLMKIQELKDRIPEQLSGGQQQRVALARAIVTEPQILLFDEPLSNLDAKMREYMRDELRKLQQRLGITGVYVTHDQAEAMAISDQVVIMNNGIIEQIGNPQDIYTKPNNKFVAYFMGKANFVEARIKRIKEDLLEVEIGDQPVFIPQNELLQFQQGDKVCLIIRPEYIHIDPAGKFQALVTQASYYGATVEYTIQIGNNSLVMTDSDIGKNGIYAVGKTIPVSLDNRSIRSIKPE